jgi:glucosylceramidase
MKMKKVLPALAIVTLLLTGCKNNEDSFTLDPTRPDDQMHLTATPAGPLTLSENNDNKVAVTFTWAQAANRGKGTSITYRFQLSLQGSSAVWESDDNAVQQRSISFTHGELSMLLTETLGATPGEPAIFEAKVVAEVTASIQMEPETSTVSITVTPYGEKKNINGVLLAQVGNNQNLFSVDLDITQNQTLTVGGMNLSGWWIDPDFFEKTGDKTLKFLPIAGKYRIIANFERKYFKVQVMNGNALATLQENGTGAIWAIGYVGDPTTANMVERNPGEAVCLAPMENGIYKLSGIGGQRFRTSALEIKFIPQHDSWRTIGNPNTSEQQDPSYVSDINNDFIRVDVSANVQFKNGWTLLAGNTYTFILDVSGGYKNIRIGIEENGAAPADPTMRDVAIYMSTADRSMTFQKTGVNFDVSPVTSAYTIRLHPGEKYQQMDGFGAAITYATCYNLLRMNASDRAAFLKETFDPVEGRGFSYVRVCIGASDFSSTKYTSCDKTGIGNFALTSEDTEVVIPVLKEILTYNPALKIMGSPWTCPRWMKVIAKGGSIGWSFWGGGYLNKNYYQDYATYFVKWIQAFEAHGVPIYSITPQNEPLNGNLNGITLNMEWDEQRDFIKTALGPKLQAAGLDVKIYVFDHNYNYDDKSNQQQYPLKIYDDADAAQYVAGAAYHSYGGSSDELINIHDQRPDKELIFTEASIGGWSNGRDLESNFANNVEEGLVLASRWCKGVILWNLMLDMNSGPHNSAGCTDCYGAVDISTDYQTITRNCQYYEVGHLSQVVKPGAYRIKSDGYNELRYEAFLNADGSYALVVLNRASAGKTFAVNDGVHSFSYTLPARSAASIRWK